MLERISILGTRPVDVNCPQCHQNIKTLIFYTPPDPTCCDKLCAFLICCLCWPCFCIAYCCYACARGIHSCPNCQAEIEPVQQVSSIKQESSKLPK